MDAAALGTGEKVRLARDEGHDRVVTLVQSLDAVRGKLDD
jgi:hypothetical protein